MIELTAEKRAEVRRLAEAVAQANVNGSGDDWRCALRLMQSHLHQDTVLSLLDALDAAEAKLQPAKAFAYVVGFSDGFARVGGCTWIGPVPNNPYVKDPR